jgi:hypothetical protein
MSQAGMKTKIVVCTDNPSDIYNCLLHRTGLNSKAKHLCTPPGTHISSPRSSPFSTTVTCFSGWSA